MKQTIAVVGRQDTHEGGRMNYVTFRWGIRYKTLY